MPSFIQSNTQSGLIVRQPTADFTGAEGLLAKQSTTALQVSLAGVGDLALFVVTEVEASNGTDPTAQRVTLQPLSGERNARAICAAAITAGATVASTTGGLLHIAVTGDQIIGVAEDSTSASGAYCLFRPANLGTK